MSVIISESKKSVGGCDPEACDKYKKAERKRGRKPKKEPESMPEIMEG